jgi:hypothetical protein
MGGDEESPEVSEALKVGQAVFVKLVSQVIQICNTIFDDSDPLGIKPIRAIEKIHDAPADHGIECHQRSLLLASHLRPPLLFVGFPERQYSIPIHIADLQRSRLTQFHPFHLSAWTNGTASALRVLHQNQ